MGNSPENKSSAEIERIVESAKRLGIELDEGEALQWLTAMAAVEAEEEVVVNVREGIFGHKVTMLDFSPDDLEHFRRVGRLVEFSDIPGVVETALALSGSAAQSKIQSYPGDADYFERVNIHAPTREKACQILGRIMREKCLDFSHGLTYQLTEIHFGTYPENVVRGDKECSAEAPMTWSLTEIEIGEIKATRPDGTPITITWDQAAQRPGWTKLDWVVADPARGQLANASNNLDVTWEAPDGTITPLDGYLDPYFQEVYLDASSIPVFSKLAQHVSADALDHYVAQLQKEVKKYLTKDLNYGKAAKRMYNIFRLTGRYEEAAFLRELFDEPATILYQVWSLMRTIDEASLPNSSISPKHVLAQADDLITRVAEVMEGGEAAEVVRLLLRLRDSLTGQTDASQRNAEVEIARAEVMNVVNNFFHDRLIGLPPLKSYIEEIQVGEKDG